MAVRIQLRRDSAADWTSENPTLAQGEIGYETDTGFLKIGDGITAWVLLDYFSPGGGLLSATASGTDTYTATITGVSAYTIHDVYEIIFTNSNTGAATININSLGAKSLKKNVSTDLDSGDIAAGQSFIIVYDGTNFQVIGLGGGTSITVGDTQVLYSDGANSPTGEAAFTYNKNTNTLTVDNIILNGETASRIVATDGSKQLDTPYTFRDEDDMVSDDAIGIPSQQSVKAYVDNSITSSVTDELELAYLTSRYYLVW